MIIYPEIYVFISQRAETNASWDQLVKIQNDNRYSERFFFVIQIKNYDTFFLGDTENETPSRTFYNAPNIL